MAVKELLKTVSISLTADTERKEVSVPPVIKINGALYKFSFLGLCTVL